jgi:hypothetical protein
MRVEIRYLLAGTFSYASYYVAGLSRLAQQGDFVFRVRRHGYPKWILPLLGRTKNQCPAVFECVNGSDPFYFCIDTHDSAHSFEPTLLAECRYYFKLNLLRRPDGTPDAPEPGRDKVRPIGPCFPVSTGVTSTVVPSMELLLRQPLQEFRRARGRLGFHIREPTVEQIVALRGTPKQHDVYFVQAYYPIKHQAFNRIRLEIMTALRACRDIAGVVGFLGSDLPDEYRDFSLARTSRLEHLRSMAASRLLVYVRGPHDCVSFKFGEQLALGVPIVGQTLFIDHQRLLPNDALRCQYAYDDPEYLVQTAREWLAQDALLQSIGEANARIFDEYFTPWAVAGEILRVVDHKRARRRAERRVSDESSARQSYEN